MIVAQILNNVMIGKEYTAGVGYGLYIMKQKCIPFKVTLSSAPLVISAKVYYGVRGTPAVLCMAVQRT